MPRSSKNSIEILSKKSIISTSLAEILKKMVGFRNIAVHEYQNISKDVITGILKNNLEDFEEFIY